MTPSSSIAASVASLFAAMALVGTAPNVGIASARCDGEPVCALVIVVYGSTPW